jgi:hypothetical protein
MTPFAVKLDENLSRAHARYLQDLGYSADRVHDEGLSAMSDDAVPACGAHNQKKFP